jgi:hypothetical protein
MRICCRQVFLSPAGFSFMLLKASDEKNPEESGQTSDSEKFPKGFRAKRYPKPCDSSPLWGFNLSVWFLLPTDYPYGVNSESP